MWIIFHTLINIGKATRIMCFRNLICRCSWSMNGFNFSFLNIFLQRQLGDMRQSAQLRIQQREKEAQELRQAIFSFSVSNNKQFGQTSFCTLLWQHLFLCCLPPALCSSSGRGKRRCFHWADSVDRAKALRGERADQSSGEDISQSGWAAPGQDPEGDCWAEEEWGWTGQSFPHRGPRLFSPGNNNHVYSGQ